MNRLAFKLLVLLLGGAIINIAIAWGCAMLCGPVDLTTELGAYGETFKDGPAYWIKHGSERWFVYAEDETCAGIGAAQQMLGGFQIWGEAKRSACASSEDRRDRILAQISERRNGFPFHVVDYRGWPARSMSCAFTPATGTSFVVSELNHGVLLRPYQTMGQARSNLHALEVRVLPLMPIWDGFAINTILFASAIWAVFANYVAIRRWRRIKRGLCAQCAYPVGVSSICSECGAGVRRS